MRLLGVEEEEGKGRVTCDGKDRIWYKYILFFMMFCMISDGKRLARRRAFWFCLVFYFFFFFGHCVGCWFSGTTLPFLTFWWLEGEGERGRVREGGGDDNGGSDVRECHYQFTYLKKPKKKQKKNKFHET